MAAPAPNAQLQALAVPTVPTNDEEVASVAAAGGQCEVETAQVRPGRISWAQLLKRVVHLDMQHCRNCAAGELKIIAAILKRPVIGKILTDQALDRQSPPKGWARGSEQDFAA